MSDLLEEAIQAIEVASETFWELGYHHQAKVMRITAQELREKQSQLVKQEK